MTAFYSASDQPTSIASPGAVMGVDWEQRVDFARLRAERLGKVQRALERSELGALILFDMNNVRYTTATHIGNWARDKFFRCVLVMRGHDPILWDIGSGARTHQRHARWDGEQSWRAGISSWRGCCRRPERRWQNGSGDCEWLRSIHIPGINRADGDGEHANDDGDAADSG